MLKQNKPPSIFFSIFLISILVVPYLAKLNFVEPYPAIIMPSGHGKMNLKDSITTYYDLQILGIKDNVVFKINKNELFSNIPGHYHNYIIRNNLGFLSENKKAAYKNSWTSKIFTWKENKLLKQDELKNYYLKNISKPIDSIKFIKKRFIKNKINDSLIEERIISKTTYSLK